MRIVNVTYKKPANLLFAALQEYCGELLSAPEQHCIYSLADVEVKIWQRARDLQTVYPRCSLDKLEVYSHQNLVHQFYHLLYNDERSMIVISARPDEYEAAFREYDQANAFKLAL